MDSSLSGVIEELAQLKRRLAGSLAEREAIAVVARRLEAAGQAPALEGFVEVTSTPLNFAFHLLLAAAAAGIGWGWPRWGLVLVVLTLGSAVVQLRGKGRGLRRLIPRGASYNLLVRRPPASRRLATLLVTAHLDVRRMGFRLSRQVVWPPLVLLAVLAVALLGHSLQVAPGLLPWVVVVTGLLLVAQALLAVVHHRLPSRSGPGTGDSGVSALEELGRALDERPLQHLEVGLVVTGCGEAHAGGLRALLEQHRHEWAQEDTFVMVLENLDEGRLVYGVGERLLDFVSYRHTLPSVAERVTHQPAWRHIQAHRIDGFTGALVPTLAGMRALTLTSLPGDSAQTGAGSREAAAFGAELTWLLDQDLAILAR